GRTGDLIPGHRERGFARAGHSTGEGVPVGGQGSGHRSWSRKRRTGVLHPPDPKEPQPGRARQLVGSSDALPSGRGGEGHLDDGGERGGAGPGRAGDVGERLSSAPPTQRSCRRAEVGGAGPSSTSWRTSS